MEGAFFKPSVVAPIPISLKDMPSKLLLKSTWYKPGKGLLPATDSCASSLVQQDALALLAYRWKQRTHPNNPDLTIQWGHLRGQACPCTLSWGLFPDLPLLSAIPLSKSPLSFLSTCCPFQELLLFLQQGIPSRKKVPTSL